MKKLSVRFRLFNNNNDDNLLIPFLNLIDKKVQTIATTKKKKASAQYIYRVRKKEKNFEKKGSTNSREVRVKEIYLM